MARQARKGKPARKQRAVAKSDYFTQPGKRGAVVVLRKPIGNRATAKVCGVMPTRVHAKMLVNQLERAEYGRRGPADSILGAIVAAAAAIPPRRF